MNIKELNTKTAVELNAELANLLKIHFSLRMQKGLQQLTKTSELRQVKRDIARVKTLISQKTATIA